MRKVMVRYKAKPERVAENEALIRKVYEQLEQQRPEGLRYATFKLADGVSFVHIGVHEYEGGFNRLTELPAFQAFQANVKERCEEAPVSSEWSEIGAYGFFGR